MKSWVFIISLVFLCGSCATYRHSECRVSRDSVYAQVHQKDSVYAKIIQHDSIYTHDSIYVIQRGDTVTKYVERLKYKYSIARDTVRQINEVHDTLYINRSDSTEIVKPVEVEKPLKPHTKLFIFAGKLCCLAAIVWAVFLYLRRRK